MARLRRAIGGLRALLQRQRVEQELDEELREYLEASVEAKVCSGMTPEAARRAARAELGSVDAVKDYTRDVGWETTFEQCRRDVRYAVRTLRKSPVFAAVVILTLTLGIGANTAIFSAVNAIMLRALPVEQPEELVALTALYPSGAEPFSYSGYRRLAADGIPFVDALASSRARRAHSCASSPNTSSTAVVGSSVGSSSLRNSRPRGGLTHRVYPARPRRRERRRRVYPARRRRGRAPRDARGALSSAGGRPSSPAGRSPWTRTVESRRSSTSWPSSGR